MESLEKIGLPGKILDLNNLQDSDEFNYSGNCERITITMNREYRTSSYRY